MSQSQMSEEEVQKLKDRISYLEKNAKEALDSKRTIIESFEAVESVLDELSSAIKEIKSGKSLTLYFTAVPMD